MAQTRVGLLGRLWRFWRDQGAAGALAMVIIAITLVLAGLQGPRIGPLSAELFDRFQRAQPRPYDPDLPVRIVAIDRESLQRYGQWPWSRLYFVELIERLEALGVAAIAFDVVFADPDRTSPEIVAETMRRFDPDATQAPRMTEVTQNDALFARRVAQSAVVLGAVPIAGEPEGPFRGPFGLVVVGSDPIPLLNRFGALETPLPVLIDNAAGYGLTGVGDGQSAVVRRAPLFSNVGGALAPSIAMEALRVAQGARGYVLRSSDGSGDMAGGAAPVLVSAKVGAVEIPVTDDGAIWLHFSGEQAQRTVPAWRVLEGDGPDPALLDELEGRIVLIGATAPGLRYVVPTPLSVATDGVEVHAEVMEQVLSGVSLDRPDWARGAEALAAIVLGLLTFALTNRRSPLAGLLFTAVLLGGLLLGSWWAFSERAMLVSPVFPAIAVAATYVALTGLNYFQSLAQERAVKGQFERFVAPQIIQSLIDDPNLREGLKGEERELTLFFGDVRGFTTLSEKMPPAQLIGYLNRLLEMVSDCILAQGGTIDKFMGDGIMAFWNAPVEDPRHAAHAIAATLAIDAALKELNRKFEAEGLPTARMGFGLNTGMCNVGLMGHARRLDYSCIGDTVNVAARIQDITKTFGVWNCVTRSTILQAPEFCAVEIDVSPIRGRDQQEPLYTVLGPKEMNADPAIIAFREALAAARAAREAHALRALEEALDAMAAHAPEGVKAEVLTGWFRKSMKLAA